MAPFEARRRSRTVPPDAHGARAFEGRERRELTLAEYRTVNAEGFYAYRVDAERVDIGGRTWTVADLQRAVAREAAER